MKILDFFSKKKKDNAGEIREKIQHHQQRLAKRKKITFSEAINRHYTHLVKRFLDLGMNPNKTILDSLGFHKYPLELALTKGYEDIALLLLEYGANPNIITHDEDQLPLLAIAVMDNRINLVSLMLQYGANPYLTGPTGLSVVSFTHNNTELKHLLTQPHFRIKRKQRQANNYRFEIENHGELNMYSF